MKIALLVPAWPPGFSPNGIVTYASQLVPAFRGLGHEVFVLTASKNCDDQYVLDIKRFPHAPKMWDRVAYKIVPDYVTYRSGADRIASGIRHIIAQHSVDVLEMEESFGWSFEIAHLSLLPVVVRLHGPWVLNGRFESQERPSAIDFRRQGREGRGIRTAHFVTSPSAEVLRFVRNHYGYPLGASRVIPNPFEASGSSETWSCATCNRNTLLFVGRSDARKGGDLVLRVFAELAAYYPDLHLSFVGPDHGIKGPDGSTWSLDRYFRSVVPEPYQSRVVFLGQMNYAAIAALRRSHFATIVASRYEIMPYSVLEAMSLGCPIVATSVGGIPELIQDRSNGLLVPSDDVRAMTAACRTLLDDHALAVRLGHQAWQDCRALYAPEKIAEQTVVAYREAIRVFRSRRQSGARWLR
jgi:glycosyltransferase involved in cell wall biosynthesis